jgi:hypothetical protein
MGVPTSEVGYTSATAGRGDHKVHKEHVVALDKKEKKKFSHFHSFNRELGLVQINRI